MKYIKLSLNTEDADTLLALLDGILGATDDDDLNRFCRKIRNRLDKKVNKLKDK